MTTLPSSISGDLTLVPNVAFTSAVNQQTQYQQVGFALHTWMLAMGATVTLSSNGTTAGAGNNITLSTHITRVGQIAANRRTWAVYSFGHSTGTTYILVNWTATNADTTPQTINVYRSEAAYAGGSNTTIPTTDPAYEMLLATGAEIIPWATAQAGYISYQHSVSAEIGWFWVKAPGAPSTVFQEEFFMMIDEPEANDPTRDNGPRKMVVVHGTQLSSFAGMFAPQYDGLANAGAWDLRSTIWLLSGGSTAFADSRSRFMWMYYLCNGPGQQGRDCGVSRLVRAVPRAGGTPYNARDPLDPVSDLWTWWTTGNDIAVLWLKSVGDML